MVLVPTPAACDALDSEGDYLPAHFADYPPGPEVAWQAWCRVKSRLLYACCYEEESDPWWPLATGRHGSW